MSLHPFRVALPRGPWSSTSVGRRCDYRAPLMCRSRASPVAVSTRAAPLSGTVSRPFPCWLSGPVRPEPCRSAPQIRRGSPTLCERRAVARAYGLRSKVSSHGYRAPVGAQLQRLGVPPVRNRAGRGSLFLAECIVGKIDRGARRVLLGRGAGCHRVGAMRCDYYHRNKVVSHLGVERSCRR